MPEMHLKQLGFTHNAWPIYWKQTIEKFMETGNTDYIYKNDLDKGCFQHDMAYGKLKDLAKRTQSDKVLRNKAFKISSNGFNGIQVFDKKYTGNSIKRNQQLANELHKPIIRKFKRRIVYSLFKTIFGL